MDPLQYWINKQNAYPKLAPVACDILAMPATTYWWIFSSASEATKGKGIGLVIRT